MRVAHIVLWGVIILCGPNPLWILATTVMTHSAYVRTAMSLFSYTAQKCDRRQRRIHADSRSNTDIGSESCSVSVWSEEAVAMSVIANV